MDIIKSLNGISFLYESSLGIGDENTWLVGCQGSGFFRTADAGASWAHVDNSPMSHGGNQV